MVGVTYDSFGMLLRFTVFVGYVEKVLLFKSWMLPPSGRVLSFTETPPKDGHKLW